MNLKIHSKLFCFAFITLALSSCYKKAITDFNFDKSEYSAGEEVIIENKTKNVKTFRWTLKNSSGVVAKFSDATPKIKLNPCSPDGDYSLTLQGATQKGKASSTTKNFSVTTIRGYLYIYNSLNSADTIEIKADGEAIGKLCKDKPLEIKIAIGTRLLTASNGAKTTLVIKEDGYYPWNVNQ